MDKAPNKPASLTGPELLVKTMRRQAATEPNAHLKAAQMRGADRAEASIKNNPQAWGLTANPTD